MADGFDIHIDQAQAERLKALAEIAGARPEDFARAIIERALEADWAEDYARLAEYERTGEAVDLEDWLTGLRSMVEARVAEPR